jgi:hypothetical protein
MTPRSSARAWAARGWEVRSWAARILAGVAMALVALTGMAVTPAAAAVATFGQPSARATFGTEIVFEQPVDLQAPPSRVEVLIEVPGSIGPHVTEVPAPSGAGRQTLRY